MTRWFYDDPLAAAWQAKHFGMQFDAPVKPVFRFDGTPTLQFIPDRFYVHPDSVALLQPLVGDLIEWWCPEAFDSHIHRFCLKDDSKPVHPSNQYKIIQRDGKAFFTPECES